MTSLLDYRYEDLSVAVVAGGKSSRFGSPKADALFGDRHLVDYAIQIGYRLSREVFLVTADPDPFENPFAPAVRDLIPNCGPLGGILTALAYASNAWVCILPCDMPLITPHLLNILIEHRQAGHPVVARSEKDLEPLLSVWPADVWPVIYQLLYDDQLSIRRALRQLKALEVFIPDLLPGYRPQVFTNINYREDLEKISGMRPAV
jgi:molybdopterin-guanine dinucleotide biosynthesis protein A